MRPRDKKTATELQARLDSFEKKLGELPGIQGSSTREVFVEQLLESIHRVEFVRRLGDRPISENRRNPDSEFYDPLKAAVLFARDGQFDEACWQVFMSVHFGRSLKSGWRLPRDIYGRLGEGRRWGWAEVTINPAAFCTWLHDHLAQLRGGDGVARRFSNHRKYQSLDAWSPNGTGAAVTSYVGWVRNAGGHAQLFGDADTEAEHDARVAFALLYEWMAAVRSFGRVARFDYLTMIGKLGLADLEPNSAYIGTSTGPIAGARLLFDEASPKVLDDRVLQLGDHLGVNMQVMEDALCNWQKSPDLMVRFRG